jgi:preprotein translocase subunit SecE
MAKGQKKSSKKPNPAARLLQYFKDVRAEMKRIVWPGREEVVSSSLIVIVTLVVFTVFVLVVDQISSFVIIEQIARLGGS